MKFLATPLAVILMLLLCYCTIYIIMIGMIIMFIVVSVTDYIMAIQLYHLVAMASKWYLHGH